MSHWGQMYSNRSLDTSENILVPKGLRSQGKEHPDSYANETHADVLRTESMNLAENDRERFKSKIKDAQD